MSISKSSIERFISSASIKHLNYPFENYFLFIFYNLLESLEPHNFQSKLCGSRLSRRLYLKFSISGYVISDFQGTPIPGHEV